MGMEGLGMLDMFEPEPNGLTNELNPANMGAYVWPSGEVSGWIEFSNVLGAILWYVTGSNMVVSECGDGGLGR